MNFLEVFLIYVFVTPASPLTIDTELVFQLRKHFRSDLILYAEDEVYSKELTKLFYKKNFPDKTLVGVIDLNDNFEKDIRKVMFSPLLNILVVSSSIKLFQKLKEFQEFMPNVMARLIWVNFINNDVQNAIRNVHIPLSSKFFLVQNLFESKREVIDVYQISGNSSKIYSVFAVWENNHLKIFNKNFNSRRRDLQGLRLNIALSAFVEFRGDDDQLWNLYSQAMNFSISYIPVNHGVIYPNGTKTGLFKLVDEGIIDTTPTNYVYTEQRVNFFDYIFPVTVSEVRLYIKLESRLNWTSYFAPFSTGVWISAICWILIASIVTKLITRTRRLAENEAEDSTLRVLRAISYQSGRVISSSLAFYISYIMPYILTIVLTQFYSGALLSYLTVKHFKSPVENLHEVIQDGTYRIMVLDGTSLLFHFQTDPGVEASAVRTNLLIPRDQLPVNVQSGFNRLCDNKYVFLCSSVGFTINEKCDIFEGKEVIFNEPLGIIVKKGFQYRDIMINLLKVFQNAGLQKLKKKNVIIRPDDHTHFKSLSMESVFPIFLIHLNALLLSAALLIFEIKFQRN